MIYNTVLMIRFKRAKSEDHCLKIVWFLAEVWSSMGLLALLSGRIGINWVYCSFLAAIK